MTHKETGTNALIRARVVAIIRTHEATVLLDIVRALTRGGVEAVEIALNSPGALDAIAASVEEVGDQVLIGAGTAVDEQSAGAAIDAGARFILSPVYSPEVLAVCTDAGVVCIPGAYTPTEIFTAWQAGADFVKVFPAHGLGVSYIKEILAPLPNMRLVPVGGVDERNAAAYLGAGASFLGVGSKLVDPELVAARSWDELSARAARFLAAVKTPPPQAVS